LDMAHKIIGSAESNELQVILIYCWGHWSSELLFFRGSPEDPEMPGLEELLTPGPGRIEVVGACSLIVPNFSMADDLLPGEVLLQQHHFGPGGVINRHLIRVSRGRLIVSADMVSSVEAEELARTGVDVGGASASEASLGATAAGRALAGSQSDSTRFGSGGPATHDPRFTYQWCMAPWGSGGEGLGGDSVALRPESLPLVPMRASLIPTLATGGPTRVLGERVSDPAGFPVVAGRVTRNWISWLYSFVAFFFCA
jgi:hypothetical protein